MPNINLLYLVGVPGAGKSALIAEVFKDVPYTLIPKPFAHLQYPGGAMLGKQRESFSGTDALSMSVQPTVLKWLKTCPYSVVVGEGDRLANDKFFTMVSTMGIGLTVILLDVPEAVAKQRRKERGSDQNPVWLKGRAAKVRKLRHWCIRTLDGRQDIATLAAKLRQYPIIRQIRGEA